MFNKKTAISVLLSGTFFFIYSFIFLSPASAVDFEHISVDSFTSSNYELGATNATYTFTFSTSEELSTGDDHYIKVAFMTLPGKNSFANLKNATVSNVSIEGNTGSGTIGDFTSFEECIDGDSYCRDGVMPISGGSIDADSEITITISGVENSDEAGAYYVYLYSSPDYLSSYSDTSATQAFGDPLIKLKVTAADGITGVQSCTVNFSTSDWMKQALAFTDVNGMAYFFESDFYTGDTTLNDVYTLRVEAPSDSITYTDAIPIENINITTSSSLDYSTSPLGPVKLTQPLVVGYVKVPSGCDTCGASAGAAVPFAGMYVQDSDYNPDNSKYVQANQSGYFVVGGLTAGKTYSMDLYMPWDDEGLYYGLTVPESITGLEVLDNNSDGIADAVRYDSIVYSGESLPLDLGDYTYRLANKTIIGSVKYTNGNPVSDVTIEAWAMMSPAVARVDTNSSGDFTLKVGGGSWSLMPIIENYNNFDGDPNNDVVIDWIYCGMSKTANFKGDDSVETSTGNIFTVNQTDATITGRVISPNGDPMSWNAEVSVYSKDGCGTNTMVVTGGEFSIGVPVGTYEVSVYDMSGNYSSPNSQSVTVSSGTVDIGDIQLLERNGHIRGMAWADQNENGVYDSGEGLGNVQIEAVKANDMLNNSADGGGSFYSTLSSNQDDTKGEFDISVDNGVWMVNVFSDPAMMGGYSNDSTTYLYMGSSSQVIISEDSLISDSNNFELIVADSTLQGKIVNSKTGEPISGIWGFAFADSLDYVDTGISGNGMGAPINNSSFTLKVPSGSYEIGVEFPSAASGYTPSEMVEVDASSGETKTVEIPVSPNDATVRIQFKDTEGNLITNLRYAEVFLRNELGGYQWSVLSTDDLVNGYIDVAVSSGVWSAGYYIDPKGNDYMNESTPNNQVTANSEEVVALDITLREVDSQITGVVYDPEGNPLPGVWVSVDSRKVTSFDSAEDVMLMSSTITGSDGSYTLELASGSYKVAAFFPSVAQINGSTVRYLNPESQEVSISPSSFGNVDFTFAESDAVILGEVTLSEETHGAFISAYSDKGAYSEVYSYDGGYTLNVTSDDIWHIKAMYQDGNDYYRSSLTNVDMGDKSEFELNLILEKASFIVPDPVTTTYNCANAKKIVLSNGTEISIPANAIKPDSISQCSADSTNENFSNSMITITVTPTAQMSLQDQSIPVGIGYEITAKDNNGNEITGVFISNVTITIPYTDAQLEDSIGEGADESLLGNGYWDTSTSAWKPVTNQTLDTDNNTLSITTNHFTLYGVISAEDVLGVSVSEDLLSPTGQSIIIIVGLGFLLVGGLFIYNKKSISK